MIQIFNYNILSTKLASPQYHKNCNPKHLETSTRLLKIKEILKEQIDQNSIICLQELSEESISNLLPFFVNHKYTFVYDSQFLGVGIAFPNKFILYDVHIISIGETLNQQCKWRKVGRFESIFNFFKKLLITPIQDVWVTAIKKTNRVIGIKLSDTNRTKFAIWTYHMPCAFTNIPLMNIHASALLSIIEKHSIGLSYILAGDFNSKPDSDVYKFITTNSMPLIPTSNVYYKVPMFTHITPLYSAYGHNEPIYTNRSGASDFNGCIDYIFATKNFKLQQKLKLNQNHNNPLPDEKEPSDHLPIGAIFHLRHDYDDVFK